MPWPKGKSRKRYYAGKRAYGTKLRRQGMRKIGSGSLSFLPRMSQLISAFSIGSGARDIARSRKYSNIGKRRR